METNSTITSSSNVANSALMVLATAIPPDQVSYAVASPSEFAAQLASSFQAGNTPAWYQALPSDVKSLLPVMYPASISATPTPTPSSSSMVMTSVGTLSPSAAHNSTSLSGVHMPTLSATRSAPAVATANAASYPGAALGAGVGAALGFLGMLAL